MARYDQFIMKNNVFWEIATPISSIATTIQLKTWQWARFWNEFPMIATIENVDGSWKVQKREIVEITWITWDNLNVVRWFAPCPPNDDANWQATEKFSFNADDRISLYIPKEIFDRIADAIVDLYDNWNDRVFVYSTWWLNIWITAWNIRVWNDEFDYQWWTATLNDNATNYVMIDWSGTITIDTTGRNQQLAKLATIITANGAITSLKRRKIDLIGWELWGGWWFKNISGTIYKAWLLRYFIADWEEFNLTYQAWRLKTIQTWQKTYTMTYKAWKLVWSVES